MRVYSDFYSYRSGVYSYTSGSYEGDHAVLLVGYDDAGQYFTVKNSWNARWGDQGYFKIGYSEISSVVNFGDWTIAYSASELQPSEVVLSSPNGGGSVSAGSAETIAWTYSGNPGNLKIELLRGSSVVSTIAASVSKGIDGAGSYNWPIPSTQASGSDYKIRITSASNSAVTDTSDNFFAVLGPSVTVTSPNGGEALPTGATKIIMWNYTGDPGYLRIELLKAGSVVATLSSSTLKGTNGVGSFNWSVPSNQAAGSDYLIRITGASNSAVTDSSDGSFTILGPSVTVTSPNGGEALSAGTVKTITWNYSGDPGYLRVELVKAGSVVATISSFTLKGSNGAGSYNWLVPSSQATGSDYRIRVTSTSNAAITDMSDTFFTVLGPSVTVTSPNGGETLSAGTTKTITWNYSGNPGSYLRIEVLKAGSVLKTLSSYVSKGTNGKGSYNWIIPSNQASGSDYKIRITSTSTSSLTDTSDDFFTVLGPSVTVTSPNGGDTLTAGTTKTITWNYSGDPGYLRIELLKGATASIIASSVSKGSNGAGSYNWNVPSNLSSGSDYRIRVTGTSNTSITDTGDNVFTVVGPPPPGITATSPNGGQTWTAGAAQTVTWTYVGDPGNVKIELLKGGGVVGTIASSVSKGSNGAGSYSWKISSVQASGADYKIRVSSTSNASVTDSSDNVFTILGPSLTLGSPNGGEAWKSGTYQTIRWTYTGDPGSFLKVDLFKGGVFVKTLTSYAFKGPNGAGSYSLMAPYQSAGSDYSIRILSSSNSAVTDTSDAYFIIN